MAYTIGYILFDNEEEMEYYYQQVVGDDGPTELKTCGPEGLLNENT